MRDKSWIVSSMDDIKVALVTGGCTEIGSSVARLYAEKGFKIAITDSNKEKVEEIAKECTDLSPHSFKALALVADLTISNNGQTVVQKAIDHFGKLDVLVNNASINKRSHPTDKSSFDLYKKTMTINVDSVIKTSMEAVPHLITTSGCIVFVSSVGPIKPAADNYAFRVSKAALSSYAKCLAVDVGSQIRVNIVSPGRMSILPSSEELRAGGAKFGPNKFKPVRSRECAEIANTIYYLSSDEASFVNGAEFFLDDGANRSPAPL